MKLLGVGRDAKTVKGEKDGYLTGILYLAPADLSGYEVCPQRSAGCTAGCLNTAGQGAFSNVQIARVAKTKRYFEDRRGFMDDLVKDIRALIRKAERLGMKPAVRLNGTSDIPWERIPAAGALTRNPQNIMELFPEVQFYDYTKITKRALAAARNGRFWPDNYHLTFSKTEDNLEDCLHVLAEGGNVSAVFRDDLPETFQQFTVIDGDKNDLRFLDPKGCIVGLKAKGKARQDTSGFVIG